MEQNLLREKKWIVFHKEIYKSQSKAMSREYELKKDRKFRNVLREKFKKMNNNYTISKNKLR